jgi:multiple sugar transport system substrate-binding protein
MLKRRGYVLIICLIFILVLAACASNGDSTQDSGKSDGGSQANAGSANTGSANSGKAAEEVVHLKFIHWINEDVAHWEDLIAVYEAENPGVKIESVPLVNNNSTSDYVKKLDLLAAAGDQMDLIMFSNIGDYVKRIDAGLLAPINSFLDEEGIDINSEYNNAYGQINGQYYGLPMKSVMNLIMINKNHLDEAGLEIPKEWTWDDYREYAKAMTTADHYGSYLHSWHHFHSLLKVLGNPENPTLFNEDGSSNMEHPLVRESLELRYQLEQVDKSSVPYLETFSQQLNYRQQFFSGRASMIPTGSFMITEWGEFTPDFEIAWAPWPKNDANSKVYTNVSGDVISIAESSKHKQEAYDFMRWLTTEGISQQGLWVPSWKGGEMTATLERMVAATPKPEAVHMESLAHTIMISNPAKTVTPPTYSYEATTEFGNEADLYLLGEQDLDTTMKNAIEKVKKIVESNK